MSAHDIKVLIRNAEGKYLAGTVHSGQLTENRAEAAVFDYLRDQVPEQIQALTRTSGLAWKAVGADPHEAWEICDLCGRRVMSIKAFFDGDKFLCADCRGQAPHD